MVLHPMSLMEVEYMAGGSYARIMGIYIAPTLIPPTEGAPELGSAIGPGT